MKNKLITINALSFLLISELMMAQNTSAYSYFGLGDYNNTENARNISLGNTGIALQPNDYLNTRNPASFLESKHVIFDINGVFKYNSISSSSATDHRFNANFSTLGLGIAISDKVSVGFHAQANTSSEYIIKGTIPFEGINSTYPITYEGNGGISSVGVQLGYKVTKNWSIGAKAKNHFGTIIRKETIDFNTEIAQIAISKNERYTGFGYGLGTQFKTNFAKSQLEMTLGAIINFKEKLSSKGENVYTLDGDYSKSETSNFRSQNTDLPLEMGLGASFFYKERYRFNIDYSQSQWDKVKSPTSEKHYKQNVYGLGFELLPASKNPQNIGESLIYRFGLNYDTGYYQINQYDANKIEVNIGVGINLKRTLKISLNYGYGMKGLNRNMPIKENYHLFNIGINFLEFWFQKRLIQ